MQSEEIRKRFLAFFENRGHKIVPSSSLVPENDPSVLFTTAGMQPLVPYLMGEAHPAGKRIADVQKCVRTSDIDEVGDATHLTFFEMLGNWSLGDYFKKESIQWSYELLTSKEAGMGLDPNRLYVTVFAGDENAPRDEESASIWQSVGIPANRIYYLPAKSNWWSPGDNGPCGPDTEIFYDLTEAGLGDLTHEEYLTADERQDVVEIWNNVFMEYEKKDGKVIGKLSQQNVDTGAGLERWATVLQGKKSVYETDLFSSLINLLPQNLEPRIARIIVDHLKAAVFMIADGVRPSNKERGYVLRRLLRRALVYAKIHDLPGDGPRELLEEVIKIYEEAYPELRQKADEIISVIYDERAKLALTLEKGLKELDTARAAGKIITGDMAFDLYQTYGIPAEVVAEFVQIENMGSFQEAFRRHQDISRAGAEQKFKGGLADTSQQTIRYHTATHLLNQALHEVLGDHVEQKGSNITPERLRFDFAHPQKMTDEEKARVEQIVNEKIQADLPVKMVTLPKDEALATGARHVFNEKYGDSINIYYIGNSLESAYSKEFCGGPHVERTGVIGKFRIVKEEAVAAGTRRIKAILE